MRYKRYRLKLKQKTIVGIASIIAFLLAGLIFLSFFTEGIILGGFNSLVKNYFGWGTVFVPAILVLLGLSFSRARARFAQPNVFLGAFLSLISLLSASSAFVSDSAGALPFALWQIASAVLSGFGAFLLFLATLAIGILIFLQASPAAALLLLVNFLGLIFSLFKKIFVRPQRPVFAPPRTIKVEEAKKVSAYAPLSGASADKEELGAKLVANLPTEGKLWEYPPLSLLSDAPTQRANRGDVKQNAAIIERTLESFGIRARVVEVNWGPTVTQYALEIALGTKLSKIMSLERDLALALAAPTGSVRIEAPIPGKSLVGIEIPNLSPELVTLKNIIISDVIREQKSKLTVGLGLDVSGSPMVADIAKMPHVLIAGTTGSGKSVILNAIISCLLFRNSPTELKLILVDPKRVELANYNGIPHLLTPVIVELEKILSALKWALSEMDRRYKLFAQVSVRNISGYNELAGFQALPHIIIIVDELADLMSFAPVEVEDAICRIAQMARATGIHLIVSTQRPSVDVITGLIKANIPCRIAFNVSSMVDSRVIIDQPGAEKLLGRGDMLFVPPDASKPMRIQGVFVSDSEINKLIEFLKSRGVAPEYTEEVVTMPITKWGRRGNGGEGGGGEDELFEEAVRTVCQYDRASASLLQRRLRVGYARAARLIDELEATGIVGPGEGAKPRDVLVRNAEEYLAQRREQK